MSDDGTVTVDTFAGAVRGTEPLLYGSASRTGSQSGIDFGFCRVGSDLKPDGVFAVDLGGAGDDRAETLVYSDSSLVACGSGWPAGATSAQSTCAGLDATTFDVQWVQSIGDVSTTYLEAEANLSIPGGTGAILGAVIHSTGDLKANLLTITHTSAGTTFSAKAGLGPDGQVIADVRADANGFVTAAVNQQAPDGSVSGRLVRYDSSWSVVWSHDWPDTTFNQIALMPDGGVAAVGSVAQASKALILRTDPDGQVDCQPSGQ